MDTELMMQKILQTLRRENTWVTCQSLAAKLDCSPRRVRYLISKINQDKNLVESSRSGYRLNPDCVHKSTPATPVSQPIATARDRKKYIYEQLIIHGRILDMDTLCDFFCISPLTLRNEIPLWKKGLANYDLHIKTKNNQIYVVGKDRDKQTFAMNMIREELKRSSFSLENIQPMFKKVNLSDIRQIVLGVLSKHQFFLDDYSLLTYILHLALFVEVGNTPAQQEILTEKIPDILSAEMFEIVQEITDFMRTSYPESSITLASVMEASLLMTTRIVVQKECSDSDAGNLDSYVGVEVTELVEEIVASVQRVFHIDMQSERLMLRFALHIKNLLVRVRNDLNLHNGQFINLKNEYPFLYVIAVHISYIISQKVGVTLSEDEISFITLHVGVLLEEKTAQQEKLICAVVAPDYYVIGKKLCLRLAETMGDQLFIDTLTTDSNQIQKTAKQYDLVLSTAPIYDLPVPVIQIGLFPGEDELVALKSELGMLRMRKQKDQMLCQIEAFVREDLIYLGHRFLTAHDAINFICDDLFEKGMVLSRFKEEIFEHERIAPSSYRNIAIAHTLSDKDSHSFIALSINKDPIQWGENLVNIVFVISLKTEDRDKFKIIFESLIKIVSDPRAVEEILKVNSYKELKELFRLYL